VERLNEQISARVNNWSDNCYAVLVFNLLPIEVIMKRFLVVAGLAVLVSGCAGTAIPVTEEILDEAGNVIKTTTRYVADSSVAKEEMVHKTLQNRDKQIVEDGKNSGFSAEFELVDAAPGLKIQVMKKVSYSERGRFEQQLPTEPSAHPAWKTIERLGVKVIDGTIIGMGINAGKEVLQDAVAKKDNQYLGDVQYNQSHNQGDGVGPVTNELAPVLEEIKSTGAK